MVPNITTGGSVADLRDLISRVNPKLTGEMSEKIAYSISKYAVTNELDARLLAAVVATESRFNAKAVGGVGELGLMQIRPEFHLLQIKNMEDRKRKLASIDHNLSVGAKYLKGLKTVFYAQYGDYRWLEQYNQGPNKRPKKFPYTKKVLQFYREFGGMI